MGIIEDALRREDAAPQPKKIDYARMKALYPKQKAALTRALTSGDKEKVAAACKKAVAEWNEIGAWPDDWARWQSALDAACGFNRAPRLESL